MSDPKAKLVSMILSACAELNPTLKKPLDLSARGATRLYGVEGALDSLSLVSLIVAVEQGIGDEFGTTVPLADERAMSAKNSPFRSVDTLADYAHGLLAEAKALG